MKVLVAKTAGFCWGVRRAMDAVLEASARNEGGAVATLGPLIHNPQALELLKKRGVGVQEDSESFQKGTLVVRAHGIPIGQLRTLKARQSAGEISLVNATCPEVAKVHAKIRKWSSKGYFTVILGTHGHAESVAHESYAQHGSRIVSSLEEANTLSDAQLKQVLIIAQTTFTGRDFDLIVDALRSRAGDMIIEKTICKDTTTRQGEAQEIAQKVDAVVIVGGKNSSNTRHLAELARSYGKPCQFVEVASELDLSAFKGIETVGVLAGASTPTWLVEDIVDALAQTQSRGGRIWKLAQDALSRPLFLGLGAGLTTLGIHTWMGSPKTWEYPLITGTYVFAMYLLAPFLDPQGLGAKGPSRARMLARSRSVMITLGSLSLLTSTLVASLQSWGSLLLLAMASFLGLGYKRKLRLGSRQVSLAAIPGSKDVAIALALAVVAVAMPLWHHGWQWDFQTWAGIFQVAALAFAHSAVHNIKEMQNDQILGRETLPIVIGRRPAKIVLAIVLGLAFTLSALSTWISIGHVWPILVFSAASSYPLWHLWHFHERFRAGRPRFEWPLELSFFLLGLLIWIR